MPTRKGALQVADLTPTFPSYAQLSAALATSLATCTQHYLKAILTVIWIIILFVFAIFWARFVICIQENLKKCILEKNIWQYRVRRVN